MRILVAGIGNVFFGDDGFGCAVARELVRSPLPAGVVVRDFGIRGLDLAFELTSGYDAAILVDAATRGRKPGELFVLEPRVDAGETLVYAHGLTPEHVLRIAHSLGGELPPVRLVACEPAELGTEDDPRDGLTPTVQAAIPEAVRLVRALLRDLGLAGADAEVAHA
jgi:hydrogenase maturation protease